MPAPETPPMGRLDKALALLFGATVLVLMWGFYATAMNTSWARIAILGTVEPYGLAVHQQLIHNYANSGVFEQSIHRGYDDNWMWSGHRALTLFGAAALYPFEPSALGLTRLLVAATALGAIPAALLGFRVIRAPWGLLAGALIYLASPAVMVQALQDYQDLAFATSFLMFTTYALRGRSHLLAAVGLVVAVLPREECVPVAAAALLTAWPAGEGPRRRYLLRLLLGGALLGGFWSAMTALFPLDAANTYDMPMLRVLERALQSGSLSGNIGSFYAWCWAPFGALALLSPITALPGVLVVVLHLTIPAGEAVDRTWAGHVHHLAPALPFFIAASIEGLGRLASVLRRARRWGQALLLLGVVGGSAALPGWYEPRARWLGLLPTWTVKRPVRWNSAWSLAASLPDDAVPVTTIWYSLTVADRRTSYTFGESLEDKARGKGLGAATHLLVGANDTAPLRRAAKMDGYTLVKESNGVMLVTWTPGAVDAGATR